MDAGTDCLKVLENKEYPLKLGYIPVKNRSQLDLNFNVSLDESQRKEIEFFKNNNIYRSISHKAGSKYLTNFTGYLQEMSMM